jgi:hypothetical protein
MALPVLAVAASLIGATRTIRLKRDWHEPAVIWSAIIGESGTLKSPAYAKAVGYLYRLHKRLQQEFKQRCAEYRRELAEYKKAKQAFDDNEGEDPGEPPEKPTLQRVVCSDTTIEKLAQILEDSPRGTLVARDELAGWLGSFCRYKGKAGGSDLPNWLEMFRAGTIIVDRKTGDRPTLFIPHAAASVTGGIQPGVLVRALTPEFLDAGLAARLLMALPPKLPKRWSEEEIAEDVEKAYHMALDGLLELDFDTNDEGEQVPRVLRLGTAARTVWVSFYNAWAKEQAIVEGELAACFSKLEGYAARFTMLHHIVTRVARGETDLAQIGPESVQAGIALCQWFANEARRIYSTLTETEGERVTRQLVDFIRTRNGQITAKEVQKSNSRKYPDADTATRALDALAEVGYGHWQDRVSDSRGGRPTRDFILHHESLPTVDDTDETPCDAGGDGDGAPPDTSDETPSPSDETSENPKENEVSSVSSIVGNNTEAGAEEEDEAHTGPGGFVGRTEVSSDADTEPPEPTVPIEGLVTVSETSPQAAWRLVRTAADLATVLQAVDDSRRIGLDTETTGLDPRKDRLRLLTLATDRGVGLVDCFAVDPRPL